MSHDVDTKTPKKGMPIKEFVAGMVLVMVLMLFILEEIHRQYEVHARPACQYNLKQWAITFKMYANESKGEIWPPIQRPLIPQNPYLIFTPDMDSLTKMEYQEHAAPHMMTCPANTRMNDTDIQDKNGYYNFHLGRSQGGSLEKLDDSYVYWGWILHDVGDGDTTFPIGAELAKYAGLKTNLLVPMLLKGAIQEAYTAYVIKNPLVLPDDFKIDDPHGDKTVYRLRNGIERYFVTDINNADAMVKAQSKFFAMHDLMFIHLESGDIYSNHEPAGMNVLYLDGHVEFLEHGTPEFSAKFSDGYLSALAGALTN